VPIIKSAEKSYAEIVRRMFIAVLTAGFMIRLHIGNAKKPKSNGLKTKHSGIFVIISNHRIKYTGQIINEMRHEKNWMICSNDIEPDPVFG
jgi:hypothetical protein